METTVKGTTTAEAIQSFLDSDMQIAMLECKTTQSVHNEYNLFAYRIRKEFPGQVKVYQRGTALYFERL
jgi:hypothetical protein